MFSVQFGGHDGLQMIWLHGWAHDHTALLKLAEFYRGRAQNHLFDLPGFGKSAPLDVTAGTEDYARALYKVLPDRESRKRIIIGHSFGARVAVQLANLHPDAVDGLIFIAGAGLKRQRGPFWHVRAKALKLLGKIANLLGPSMKARYAERFGSADYRAAGALRQTFIKVVNEDLSDKAANITIPTLLIYGRDDNEAPVEIGEKYEQLIKGSRLLVLEGYGHLDILARGVHQCQLAIDRFIAGEGAKSDG